MFSRHPPGRIFVWLFVPLVAAAFIFIAVASRAGPREPLSLDQFRYEMMAGNVAAVTVERDQLLTLLKQESRVNNAFPNRIYTTPIPADLSSSWPFIDWLLSNASGARIEVNTNDNLLLTILVPLIPWALIFIFIWFFVFRSLRKSTAATVRGTPVYIVPPPAPAPEKAM